ncbi:hypothetical protein [Bradyrhizobium cosmicum]|nr:hypothetical protein [Bradyrhizobium cosmicum]
MQDVLHHIDLATAFAGGLDRNTFAADLRAVYAGVWKSFQRRLAACQKN